MNKSIMIIGAGHQGLAMAAHFAISGERVNLWNRTRENIEVLTENPVIHCLGVVSGDGILEKVSDDMSEVVGDTVFVTTPSTAYRDIAARLAPLLKPASVIFLNPGRTFGAIEFLEALSRSGCDELPTVVETQSIVYTCRKVDDRSAQIYALKNSVKMSAAGRKLSRDELYARIPECVRDRFLYVDSFLETSLGNIGMILHCAPVLMNIGWIESEKHNFAYYYDGVSKTVGRFIEKLDAQRLAVAKKIGVTTDSLIEWFNKCYGVGGNSVFECIRKNDYYREIDAPRSLNHRYLDEGIPNGLVPVEALGLELGVDVSEISLIIDLACSVMEKDYRKSGRRYTLAQIQQYL